MHDPLLASPDRRLSPSIENMQQSENRVAKRHPGTGVPHRLPNPLLHILSIAVSGALDASSLAFLIGTLLKALQSIDLQFLALGA